MSSTTSRTSRTWQARQQPKDGCPCPTCGRLPCLCRPRFFSGQLLTDEDLSRLNHYVVEKNKLHNRSLHGWGTVCGLEVLCHPCDNQVLVKSGYALSPCGEDIVVCEDEVVDICKLIKECKQLDRRPWDCDPPRTSGDEQCPEIPETWILAICYDEKLTRGVTPLRGAAAPPCCCRCDSEAKPGCECRCHEKIPGNGRAATSAKRSAKHCEPTVVCESYKFTVYKAPESTDEDPLGPLLTRLWCCIKQLGEAIPRQSTNSVSDEQREQWFCRLKHDLMHLLATHPGTNCKWRRRLEQITFPESHSSAAVNTAYLNMTLFLFEYLIECLCSSLLPPCPGEVCDNRVPLAAVTVSASDCQILKICNWTTHRRIVTSFPNLHYWLSSVSFIPMLREVLQTLCCERLIWRSPRIDPTHNLPETAAAWSEVFSSAERWGREFAALWNSADIPGDQPLSPLAVLGWLIAETDGRPGGSGSDETGSDNPALFFLLNFLVKPILAALRTGAATEPD